MTLARQTLQLDFLNSSSMERIPDAYERLFLDVIEAISRCLWGVRKSKNRGAGAYPLSKRGALRVLRSRLSSRL